jgi:hypothetical protein
VTANGTTDDTAVLNTAIQTAKTLGLHRVILPLGTILVNPFLVPTFAGFYGCAQIPGGVWVEAPTPYGCRIKLAAHQTHSCQIVINTSLDGTGHETDGGLVNVIVDGDGANQTVYGGGVSRLRARHYTCRGSRDERLRRCCRASRRNLPFQCSDRRRSRLRQLPGDWLGRHPRLWVCIEWMHRRAANQLRSTRHERRDGGIHRLGVHGGHQHGSKAQNCGDNGFNSEGSQVIYNGCDGGGIASSGASWPYTPSQSLGNSGSGFCCNVGTGGVLSDCEYNGCTSTHNTGNGLVVLGPGSAARVHGGSSETTPPRACSSTRSQTLRPATFRLTRDWTATPTRA